MATRMKLPSRKAIVVGIALGCITIICCQIINISHEKTAWLNAMGSALLGYAMDNGGRFPNQDGNPSQSLDLLLNPKYLHNSNILAGFTGRIGGTEASFCAQSSWIYVPGLTTNSNPKIAILWDRKIGLDWSGRKSISHYYIAVDGQIHQVPVRLWDQFLIQQEVLRNAER